ncbi:MAG: HD domain-containing protein [Chloroflexi bacterium]|nr:HD domain-containing protein [Chloroflexota bacterium]
MNDKFTIIYKQARVYWDTRFNDIHVPLAYDFARRLLFHYPEANEEVVVPAILLHDNGWKMVAEDEQLDAFGPNATNLDLRRLHETEGARIAREILMGMAYDPTQRDEIVQIIDGHDSRQEALSLNDKLVKDADKLWRFTAAGLDIDHQRFGVELGAHLDWIGQLIEAWMFTPEAKGMAKTMWTEAKTAVFQMPTNYGR